MDYKLYKKPMSWWEDKVVSPLVDIKNRGGEVISRGAVCQVRGKYKGFQIQCDKVYISRVKPHELVYLGQGKQNDLKPEKGDK